MPPAVANVVFWIAASCCLVAQIAVVWSAIRAPMPGTNEGPVPMPRRSAEIAWTIVPAIGLAFLLVSTWRAMHRPRPVDHSMPGMTHRIEE